MPVAAPRRPKAKTARPPHRATSYRPRSTARRRPAARRSSPSLRRLTLPGKPWLVLSGLIAVAIVGLITAPLLVSAFEAAVQAFGVGLALLVIAIAVDLRIRPEVDTRFLRLWAGLHLLLFASFGIAALFSPAWQLGDVSFAETTAGGDAGSALIGSVPGVLVWLSALFGGLALVWPAGARAAGIGALGAVRSVASLELHQSIGSALKTFVVSLLPRAEEEEDDKLLTQPYVSQWDEEWAESPVIVEPDDDLELATEDGEADDLFGVAGDNDGFQRELPIGRPAGRGWELPPLDLLTEASEVEVRPIDNEARAQLIIETLASFGVDARVASINQGPTVTQFGVEPGWETKTRSVPVRDERGRPIYDREGRAQMRTEVVSRTRVRVNKITNLGNDLALALAAPTIRIEAPVPGKPIIGIEVPNTTTGDRPRQGRVRRAIGRRPDPHAALAHRRRYRQRQERLHQLHHRLTAPA